MKSVIELDINLPQARMAELFTDPANNTKWMDDIERIEPLSGKLGEPGSTYRLVPKRGKLVFVATVVSRDLPAEAKLSLDAPSVSVSVASRFLKLSEEKTKLVSEQTFRFKGLFNAVFGFLAQSAIRRAHRRHMESFKRFAEKG
jgi:hypothetical protein